MSALAIFLGVLIGLSLGLLGGGGSVLTVPIFVYVLQFPAKEAIAMSLAVVGITSLVGAIGQWRSGHLNFRGGLAFAAVAMVGSFAGTRLSGVLSGAQQMLMFSIVMLAAALSMFRGRRAVTSQTKPPRSPREWVLVTASAGLAVGIVTGLLGVGGGFLIVPAMVLLGLSMHDAIGTSLMVIAANCVVGVAGYLGQVSFTWSAVALVTIGTLPGILIGTRFNRLISQETLRRAFAVFLGVIAVFMLYQDIGRVLGRP